MVTQVLGDVPPDQLPGAIATQIQGLPQDQVQAMIGSLFPGVDPAQLPQVVAASFPEIPLPEIEGLLGMVFPGQQVRLPDIGGPVGGRIALGVRNDERGADLYVINAMGGNPTVLMEGASEPDYSPDGSQLIYYSWAPDKLGLRIMQADGTEDVEVTTNDADSYPSYAPDGNTIAFHNMAQNSVQVIKRCIDCGGFHETDRHEIAKGEYPSWSPVGDQVAYRGCLGGGQCGLIVANADGSGARQITTHANDAAPRWSPNGGQIVFHSDRDGNWEVYVINVDGSWLRRITINPTTDVMPVWSPDGLSIAFRSDRGGQWSVYKTSGIGGPAFKLFDADLGDPWAWGRMDWVQ
jgi:dipeptidyl aminopeptidase/acylaminoacyl peptidase